MSSATAPPPPTSTLAGSARRIAPLAWPVFVGQLSVLAFATIDTVLVARASAIDLAALAVGAAAYVTVFIGLMGVVLALSPIVGQLFGADQRAEAGRQVHQALWVAGALALLGSTLLVFPDAFLALSGASPAVAEKVRGYLMALAFSLPASLLFTVYRGFNVAVSRPKAVMVLQVAALGVKLPLSSALVFGLPGLGVPALGVTGCGIATCVAMWAQVVAALWLLRRDRFYADFRLFGRGLDRPDAAALRRFLRLGLPMGAAILVEVTGFAFMAIFIARLGTTPVAGHQLAANLVSMLFMMPLALANATGTLVAQRIGAGDIRRCAPAGLARPAVRLRGGCADGWRRLRGRSHVLRLYTGNPAGGRRGPASGGLGGAVPHGRCGADGGRVRAARLSPDRGADVDLRRGAVGRGPGRRLLLAFNLGGAVPPALRGRAGSGSHRPPAWWSPGWRSAW